MRIKGYKYCKNTLTILLFKRGGSEYGVFVEIEDDISKCYTNNDRKIRMIIFL